VLQWHSTAATSTADDTTAFHTAAGAATAADSHTHTIAVPAELSSYSYSDEQSFLQRIAAGGTVYESVVAWLGAVQPDPAFLRRALEKTGSYSFPAAEAPFLAAVLSHGGLARCAMLQASASSDSSSDSAAIAGREADVLRAWAAVQQLRVHLRTQKQQFKVAHADRTAAAAATAAVLVVDDSSPAEPTDSSTAVVPATVAATTSTSTSSATASSGTVDAASDASSDVASDVASDVSTIIGDTPDTAANTDEPASDTLTAAEPQSTAATVPAAVADTAAVVAAAAAVVPATFDEYLAALAERSLFLLSVEPSCTSASGQHRAAVIEPHTAELMSRCVYHAFNHQNYDCMTFHVAILHASANMQLNLHPTCCYTDVTGSRLAEDMPPLTDTEPPSLQERLLSWHSEDNNSSDRYAYSCLYIQCWHGYILITSMYLLLGNELVTSSETLAAVQCYVE
jgi:hypothetical protein